MPSSMHRKNKYTHQIIHTSLPTIRSTLPPYLWRTRWYASYAGAVGKFFTGSSWFSTAKPYCIHAYMLVKQPGWNFQAGRRAGRRTHRRKGKKVDNYILRIKKKIPVLSIGLFLLRCDQPRVSSDVNQRVLYVSRITQNSSAVLWCCVIIRE